MKNRCVSSGSANIYSVVRIIEGVKNFNIIFCELPFSTAAAVGQNLYLMHISEIFNAKKWEFLSYMYTHIRVHLSYQTFRSALWSEKFHDKFSLFFFAVSDFLKKKYIYGNIEKAAPVGEKPFFASTNDNYRPKTSISCTSILHIIEYSSSFPEFLKSHRNYFFKVKGKKYVH